MKRIHYSDIYASIPDVDTRLYRTRQACWTFNLCSVVHMGLRLLLSHVEEGEIE